MCFPKGYIYEAWMSLVTNFFIHDDTPIQCWYSNSIENQGGKKLMFRV